MSADQLIECLRAAGKHRWALNQAAIQTAGAIQKTDSSAARWVAADARRELEIISPERLKS